MTMKRRQGATLALVVAVTLVLALLGLAFFFLIKILGGSRELQHAVDAGNLNVAKQSLRRPYLSIFSTSSPDLVDPYLTIARTNFSAVRDPEVNELDLLVYNRAVGQALLVAVNAAADQVPEGISNAQTLINVLSHPSEGIGHKLSGKLKNDQQQDVSFSNIASVTPMKMLNPGGMNASPEANKKDISFMARNFATNLAIQSNVIPVEFGGISPGFLGSNTVTKDGTVYVKGYSFIDVPGVTDNSTFPLMGVPLRPRERPHLVAVTDFLNLQPSPLPGNGGNVNTRVPPNSFRSAGSSAELKSGQRTEAHSCAIVGSVEIRGEFPTSIPCGYIIVANGDGSTPYPTGSGPVTVDGNAAGLTDYAYAGSGNDIFTDLLMNQSVYVMPNGAMDTNLSDITNIQNFKQNNPGQPLPSSLVNALDGPAPKQNSADGINPGDTAAPCTNYNSTPTSPGANPTCFNNLSSMAATYGFSLPTGGSGNQVTGLMAVEKLKAQVINPRPGGGPAIVTGLQNVCTGIKLFPNGPSGAPLGAISSSEPTVFGLPPTLGNLLDQFKRYPPTSGLASTIYNQFITKIYQIKPETTAAELSTLMANPMPMGAVRYVWMDPNSRQLKFTDSSNPPPNINLGQINPDGGQILASTGWIDGNRTFVNIEGEQGYPSPWDCFGGPERNVKSDEWWIRSSGFNCLQGILRFRNCANAGSAEPWDCPC